MSRQTIFIKIELMTKARLAGGTTKLNTLTYDVEQTTQSHFSILYRILILEYYYIRW